jgi:xylulokinase
VTVPAPGEYVALGAARQAAWALGGTAQPPTWTPVASETYEAEPTPLVREAYAQLRDRTSTWN